jgi:uncharacterized protein YjcR
MDTEKWKDTKEIEKPKKCAKNGKPSKKSVSLSE